MNALTDITSQLMTAIGLRKPEGQAGVGVTTDPAAADFAALLDSIPQTDPELAAKLGLAIPTATPGRTETSVQALIQPGTQSGPRPAAQPAKGEALSPPLDQAGAPIAIPTEPELLPVATAEAKTPVTVAEALAKAPKPRKPVETDAEIPTQTAEKPVEVATEPQAKPRRKGEGDAKPRAQADTLKSAPAEAAPVPLASPQAVSPAANAETPPQAVSDALSLLSVADSGTRRAPKAAKAAVPITDAVPAEQPAVTPQAEDVPPTPQIKAEAAAESPVAPSPKPVITKASAKLAPSVAPKVAMAATARLKPDQAAVDAVAAGEAATITPAKAVKEAPVVIAANGATPKPVKAAVKTIDALVEIEAKAVEPTLEGKAALIVEAAPIPVAGRIKPSVIGKPKVEAKTVSIAGTERAAPTATPSERPAAKPESLTVATTVTEPAKSQAAAQTTTTAPLPTEAVRPNAAPAVQAAAAPVADTAAQLADRVIDMGVSGQWIDDVAREIANVAGSDGNARFRLAPPNLGAMQVEVRQGQHSAQVRLTVETDAAEAALKGEASRLVADARLAAVNIDNVVIDRAPQPAQDASRHIPAPAAANSSDPNPRQNDQSASNQQQPGSNASGQSLGQGGTAQGQGGQPFRKASLVETAQNGRERGEARDDATPAQRRGARYA